MEYLSGLRTDPLQICPMRQNWGEKASPPANQGGEQAQTQGRCVRGPASRHRAREIPRLKAGQSLRATRGSQIVPECDASVAEEENTGPVGLCQVLLQTLVRKFVHQSRRHGTRENRCRSRSIRIGGTVVYRPGLPGASRSWGRSGGARSCEQSPTRSTFG